MTPYTFTIALTFVCFFVALFRARWVALALAPPCLLILARLMGLVDISSASHPLRIATALLGLSLATWAAWWYSRRVHTRIVTPHFEGWGMTPRIRSPRALVASVLVFASDCADIPALFTWQIPGVWVLVPIQIAVCAAVIFILLAPERWLPWIR